MIWTKIVKLSRRGKSLELGLDTEADVPGGNTMYAPMVKPSDVPYVAQSHHHTVQAYPDICAPDDSTYNIAAGIVIWQACRVLLNLQIRCRMTIQILLHARFH